VFGAVEDAVSGIFRRQRRRHLVISKLLFLAFIATFGVILLLGRWVLALADTLLTVAGATALTDGIVSSPVVGVAMSFVGNALAFGVLVRYFGSVRVTYRHLLAGATLFFLLWEGAKHVFMLYLRYVARFSVLYGSVSTVMVLVVWIFYTVCIFLYCAEVVKLMTGPGPGDAVRSGSAV
jgi:membrane protein